ncbi:uncharacterized protein [Lolium perenne]|uniref:uncharacterized protein n=1 Tax=Lolium perenne TaxID=4522 RepID=UPI0021F68D5D|nr:uncharacterized protein LOC127329030 [Lolium perenne]
MSFKVMVALRARRMEKWIRVVKMDYLDNAPIKEFFQDGNIRFCGATISKDMEMLSPYGIHITSTYDLQKKLPNRTNNHILSLYDLVNSIIGTNLEKKKRKKYKKKDAAQEKEDELIFGWAIVPLSYEQVRYAALDARLGFEMARRHWMLVGCNSHIDRLNI